MANFGIQIGSGGVFIQDRPLAGLHDDLLHEVELKEPEITFQDMFRWASMAEERSFDFVEQAEGFHGESYTALSGIALATRKIRIGTAVSPIYLRHPALMASQILNLHILSAGRAMLGLGWGGGMGLWPGAFSPSIERMREYIHVIRLLLRGGRVHHQGKFYTMNGSQLLPEGRPVEIPIYIGAGGPKALRLAGEIADGVYLPTLESYKFVEFAMEQLKIGSAKAGRKLEEIDVISTLEVCVADEDLPEAKAYLRDMKVFHFLNSVSETQMRLEGLEEVRQKAREAMKRGAPKEARSLITDDILDTFCIYGSLEECRKKLDRYHDLGIRHYRIHPNGLTFRQAVERALQLLPLNSKDKIGNGQ